MISSKILITGAAGYIGGSIVTALVRDKNSPFQKSQIKVAVRGQEQADAFAELGVEALQIDLTDASAVADTVVKHEIDFIVNTASSLDPRVALNLIHGLKKYGEVSKSKKNFIHTSGLSAFFPNAGWPEGSFKDTDRIFEVEKQLADSFPIRKTDTDVIEQAEAAGVTSFIVVPSIVYGAGSGPWNKMSVCIPPVVTASIAQKKVHKFSENIKNYAVHITDMADLYVLLIKKIVLGESVPNGKEGYYMALGHELRWWVTLDHLAAALKARGLLEDTQLHNWDNDEVAAEALGVPASFVKLLWNSGANLTAENAFRIGWKPNWDEERFLKNINDEIDATILHGKAKSSLLDSLFQAAKQG